MVYVRTSEFLTSIMKFLEEDFAGVPVPGRWACPSAAFMKRSENPDSFCDADLREQSRDRLCSHGVLDKSTSHPHCGILTQLLFVKHLSLTRSSDSAGTAECCFQ